MKYIQWLAEWLEHYIKPSSKIRTYERYSQLVNLHIAPIIGEYEMSKLTPLILQRFVTQLLRSGNIKTHNGLSPNTVNTVITILQNSLKTAYGIGLTEEYFGDKLKRPKITENQIECFTLAEQKQIERAVLCSRKIKLFGIILCLYTGLRIGELLALTWQDIDLKKGLLNVNKSCHNGKSENGIYTKIIDTVKTANSARTIPIPKQLLPRLKEMKYNSTQSFVISDKDKSVAVRSYQRSFELLLKKINVPRHGFHALRHTFATRAIESGMDIKTLSELMGHKNSAITLNRYAHSLLEHKVEMMNKLGLLL